LPEKKKEKKKRTKRRDLVYLAIGKGGGKGEKRGPFPCFLQARRETLAMALRLYPCAARGKRGRGGGWGRPNVHSGWGGGEGSRLFKRYNLSLSSASTLAGERRKEKREEGTGAFPFLGRKGRKYAKTPR